MPPGQKAALAAAKARGVVLGGPELGTNKASADAHAANVRPMIREIRQAGATSLHQIAKALNARGITAPRGGQWYAKSVSNILARLNQVDGVVRTCGRHGERYGITRSPISFWCHRKRR